MNLYYLIKRIFLDKNNFLQFVDDKFIDYNCKIIIIDYKIIRIINNKKIIKLVIYDIDGNEKFNTICKIEDLYLEIVILEIDLTNIKIFENIEFINKIKEKKMNTIYILFFYKNNIDTIINIHKKMQKIIDLKLNAYFEVEVKQKKNINIQVKVTNLIKQKKKKSVSFLL